MNLTTIVGKTSTGMRMLCLAGLLSFPVVSLQASNISLTELGETMLLKADDSTVKQVFDYIERHSKYVFVYDQHVKNLLTKKVNVATKGKSVEDILAAVCSQTGLKYHINDRQVTISLGEKVNKQTFQRESKRTAGRKIKGVVGDGNNEPLIGATVKVKGTNIVTVTDMDGNFELEVPSGAELVVSYIGFNDQTVKISGSKSKYDVELQENTNSLDELVVIGYGTVKKKDLTGAVAAVKGDELVNKRTTMLSNALQGSLSGVTVSRNSSAPGSGASSIRVRGITTIGESSPLVIVDGVESTLDYVNANDVESISVLKDAAAASIYGSKAAAGVILVTTKRGNDTGKIDLKYNAEFG